MGRPIPTSNRKQSQRGTHMTKLFKCICYMYIWILFFSWGHINILILHVFQNFIIFYIYLSQYITNKNDKGFQDIAFKLSSS